MRLRKFGKLIMLITLNIKNYIIFFGCFSIDLKSSNNSTQSIINNWIDENIDYDYSSWHG